MKGYIKEFNKIYSIPKLIAISALLVVLTLRMDFFDTLLDYFENSNGITTMVSVSIVATLIHLLRKFKFVDAWKMPTINGVDYLLVLCLFYALLINMNMFFDTAEMHAIIGLMLVFLGLVIALLHSRIEICKQPHQREYNVYDLKDIYDGGNQFRLEAQKPIFIQETEVDYDLLGRSRVIDHIYDVVINLYPEQKFVIGLEGKWGSGKSTLLANLKARIDKKEDEEVSNIVIINDFDPWSFQDEESLFGSMLDMILRESGFKHSPFATKND